MTVIDIITADAIEDGDTIRYGYKGRVFIVEVKGTPEDTGSRIVVRGYSHETGDNITVKFNPDQRVDILGS